MRNIEFNKSEASFITSETDAAKKWYYNEPTDSYICVNERTGKYCFNIPFKEFPTEEQFAFNRTRSLARQGLARYIPKDVLAKAARPRSQAVLKIMKHKEEKLRVNNN